MEDSLSSVPTAGLGGGFTDVILYVIFIVVKMQMLLFIFFFLLWFDLADVDISQCMWYLMDMIEIIFPNFYKLPNVYLQVCRMIYF